MCTYDDYTFMNSVRKRGGRIKGKFVSWKYEGSQFSSNEVATNDDKVFLTLGLRKS